MNLWGEHSDLPFYDAVARGCVGVAEQRAVSLLERMVPRDFFLRYVNTGELPALGQLTGNEYIIRHRDRTMQVNGMGEQVCSFCMHSPYGDEVPATDDVISLWLIIQGHEDRFLNTANKWEYRDEWGEQPDQDFDKWCSENIFEGILELPDEYVSPLKKAFSWLGDSLRRFDMQTENEEPFDLDLNIEQDIKVFGDMGCQETLDLAEEDDVRSRVDKLLVGGRKQSRQMSIDERQNRLAYRFRQTNFMNYNLDTIGLIPLPMLDAEGSHVIRGLASCIFMVEPINFNMPVVYYNSPRGFISVVLKEWASAREIDNTALFLLLSTWREVHPFGEEIPPTNPLTKVIMSAETFRSLTGAPAYCNEFDDADDANQDITYGVDMAWQGRRVLIDDRVGPLIISLPDAANLGVIISGRNNRAGMAVLEPANILIQSLYDIDRWQTQTQARFNNLVDGPVLGPAARACFRGPHLISI
jgi:hypothetical protein